jgi:general stress protein 26
MTNTVITDTVDPADGGRDEDPDPRALDSLLDRGRALMLMTAGPDGEQGRPLISGGVEGNTIRCLVNRTAAWMRLFDGGASVPVTIVVADQAHSTFVHARGHATVRSGRAEVDELWSPVTAAFFAGPDDPDLAILAVEADSGRWWSGPSGTLGRAVAVARAAIVNHAEAVAEQGQLG